MCLRATVPYYLSNLGQVEDSFIVPVDLLVQLQLLGRWELHKAEKKNGHYTAHRAVVRSVSSF